MTTHFNSSSVPDSSFGGVSGEGQSWAKASAASLMRKRRRSRQVQKAVDKGTSNGAGDGSQSEDLQAVTDVVYQLKACRKSLKQDGLTCSQVDSHRTILDLRKRLVLARRNAV